MKNILDDKRLAQRKDNLYLILVCTAAISTFVCLCVACLLAFTGAIGISFFLLSAVLLFIWPLLVIFMSKYAQSHESLEWICDLLDTHKGDIRIMNFI